MFGKIRSIFGGGQDPDPNATAGESVMDVEVQLSSGRTGRGLKTAEEKTGAPMSAEDTLLEGELRAAQKIQMSLVPKTFPPIPGCLPFDLYAILEPAREIGGDFYDFWLNGRENLVLVIGDVSGKGIPAALFMAVCRTYLRAFSRTIREPARLLEFLNNEVSRHNESCMFVTLVCAVVHIPTGEVMYANAGHNPPLLRKRGGEVGMLDVAEDMPVGFMNGAQFVTRSLKLEEGDSLLFYTDGMPEAFNDVGDMLGDERAIALFAESGGGGSCRSTIGQLRAEIDEFAGGAEQSDDLTLMMYTQMKQRGGVDTRRHGAPCAGPEDDMFTLSNLKDALPRPQIEELGGEDLGLSLSGFSDR